MRIRLARRTLPIVACLALVVVFLIPRAGSRLGLAAAAPGGALTGHPTMHSVAGLPLSFAANHGQFDSRVRFVARMGGSTLFLTARDAVFSLAAGKHSRAVIQLHMSGASRSEPRGQAELPGKVNYFIGRHRWTNIPTYSRVVYPNVYPHTDLVYYGKGGHLEYDWVLKPGASPDAIRLQITGTTSVHIDARGNLILGARGAVLRQGPPVAYQQGAAGRAAVAARYILAGAHDVRLELGAYDRNEPLIVDPPVLSFSTYLGQGNLDSSYSGVDYFAIAVDGAGNAYVTGNTSSGSFPVAGSSRAYQGKRDMFITKLNSTGTQILYSTYLGGSGDDGGLGIAVGSSGDAYVSGATSSTDFPKAGGGTLPQYGGYDAVVVKLDPTGATLLYTGLFGSSGDDFGWGIALDSTGNAYITGFSASHAFVAAFSAAGAYLGSSVLTSNGYDSGVGIALDSNNNVWISGYTSATSVTGSGGLQASYGGGVVDGFVAEFAAHTLTQQSFTYLGGSGEDYLTAIAIDASNNIYVFGSTKSSNFPTKNAFQSCATGSEDVFIVKLNSSATAMTYGTCLGGSKDEYAGSIAVDGAGEATVVGGTLSPDFPVTNAIQSKYGGGGTEYGDGFVARINAAGGGLVYSTYLGGSGEDTVIGLALDSAGDAYVAGWTKSSDLPTAPSGDVLEPSDPDPSGASFVAKISTTTLGPPPVAPTPTATPPSTPVPTAMITATSMGTPTLTVTSGPAAVATVANTATAVATETGTTTVMSTATAVPTATMTRTAAHKPRKTPIPTATPTGVPPPDSPTLLLKPSRQVTAGSKLKITVVTEPDASVQITVRVKKKKATLYKVTLSGKAKASGKYRHTLTITYFPSSKIKATIAVTVKTAGGDAVNSASITIVPKK